MRSYYPETPQTTHTFSRRAETAIENNMRSSPTTYPVRKCFGLLGLFALCLLFLLMPPAVRATGTWTRLVNPSPTGVNLMLLLSDGTVMALETVTPLDYGGADWYRLTPDYSGSYVRGTWSTLAPMHDARAALASQVLMDGRVFVAGGEYRGGMDSAEVYDPLLDVWNICPGSGETFADSISEILPNGNVLIAPVGPTTYGGTTIYNPNSNAWSGGPTTYRYGNQTEASWVKLPDNSILTIDPYQMNSERYIPSLDQWINDGDVPIDLWGENIGELGAAFLFLMERRFI
jgi:hypothetical protein